MAADNFQFSSNKQDGASPEIHISQCIVTFRELKRSLLSLKFIFIAIILAVFSQNNFF